MAHSTYLLPPIVFADNICPAIFFGNNSSCFIAQRELLSYRFVVGVLGDEFAADSEIEDGLAELLDVFEAGCEAREVTEVKTGVLAEGWRVRGLVQALQGGCRHTIPPALPLHLRCFQPIT